MNTKGVALGIVALLVIAIVVTMASTVIVPAEAKEYYRTRSGHLAVRYYSWDIPSSLRPYISMVEYDLAYQKRSEGGRGYGVRLYLTNLGMEKAKNWYWAKYFAWYITTNPEWPSRGRSENSVAKEIQWHCRLGYMVQAIEYYYDDLPWHYRRLYGP
jgi:hypothetical protein